MSTDLLSQDEIDALLHGVDSGAVKTDDDRTLPGEPRPYDFATQERLVRGKLPTLEMVNERFARLFRIGVFALLRRNAEIGVRGVEMLKFADYLHSLLVPSSLSMTRIKPLRGTALVVFEPRLVFTLVDNFFGGDGRFPAKIEGREFSQMEQRVIQILLRQVYADLTEAWQPVMPLEFEFVQHEVNPHFANIVAPREYVVVSRFHLELEGGSGHVHLVLPYAMIEPHRAQLEAGLQSDRSEMDEHWPAALRSQLHEAQVEVTTVLARLQMSLRELGALKAGDIIPFDMPAHAEVQVERVPTFAGEFGLSNGRKAVKLGPPLAADRPPNANARPNRGASP
jgi:flagellar motor switch protein FliM